MFPSGLRSELRAEEEKGKEKDQERRDLEETVDVLRKELNKTEQARKDASIKVNHTNRTLIKTDSSISKTDKSDPDTKSCRDLKL